MNENIEMEASPAPPGDAPAQQDAEAPPADELERLRSEVEEYKDKFLRCKAEHQNAARRAANAQAEAVRFANSQLLRELLPAIDDLERLLSAEAGGDVDTLKDAVRLIHENLAKVLRNSEVSVIETVGRPFDPALHEALSQQPSNDVPAGLVMHEFQRGYRLHDRTLRAARVIVSSGPPTAP